MNQAISGFQLPNAPSSPSTAKYAGLAGAVAKLFDWARDVTNQLQIYLNTIQGQLNSQVQGVGEALEPDNSGAIYLTNAIHHIASAAAISSINAPDGFSGPVFLLPDQAFTLVTGGNIAIASQAVVDRLMTIVYDPNAELWYPSY